MGKMSELNLLVSELKHCGEALIGISESLSELFTGNDAQEHVDRVDAPPEVLVWLQAFTEAHYQPEPKRRKRPDSFRPLTDRFGNPASVSTGKAVHGPRAPASPPVSTMAAAPDSTTPSSAAPFAIRPDGHHHGG